MRAILIFLRSLFVSVCVYVGAMVLFPTVPERFSATAAAFIFAALTMWLPPSMSPARAETVLLALGDSLTAGYGVPQGQSYPDKLEAALRAKGHAARVINAGVSGDTSAGGRARLGWVLGDNPDAVIVALGGNDALRGLPPSQMYENLDAILQTLKEKGVAILLAGMQAPPNLGPEYTQAFNDVYRRLAEKYDVVFYPFLLEGVAAEPALNQGDGIHPTGAGYDVLVANILPSVEKLLSRVGG